MAWNKKTWQDRVSEYPNRRRLDDTGVPNTYDIARDEGNVMVEGDAFNAETMNDFETRIDDGFNDIRNRTINGKPLSSDVSLTPSDIGAQPQTAARSSMIKADSSGNLIAADPGVDYLYEMVPLFQGNLNANNVTITLNDNFYNYKALTIVGTTNRYGHNAFGSTLPVVKTGNGSAGWTVYDPKASSGNANMLVGYNALVTFQFINQTQIKSISGFSATARITAVYGWR